MSIHDQASFLKRSMLQPVSVLEDLNIPKAPAEEPKSQSHGLAVGTSIRIVNADYDHANTLRLESYEDYDGLGYRYYARDLFTGGGLTLSNWQITELQRLGRFFVAGATLPENVPDSVSAIPEEDLKEAERKLRYVRAILHASKGYPDRKPPGEVIVAVAAKHAAECEGGETPPSITTLKRAIERHQENPAAGVLALVKKRSRGNRNKEFSTRMRELVDRAVEFSWRLPKGSAQSARRRYERLLRLPEFADVKIEACDAEGNIIKPADRSWDRLKAEVPHYRRDFLRHGPDLAMNVHSVKIPQMLPDAPMDVVEVDFVRTDTRIIDDRFDIIYGRAWGAFFKDRMSGAVAAYSLFFGSPDFEAFLAAFKMMVFPKDMSGYEGLEYPIHGFPVAIVSDADPVLRSAAVSNLYHHFDIVSIELQGAKPGSKGALERFFRTQNDLLFHNLPGTTDSNPQRRGKFDDEMGKDCPTLTFTELDRSVMAMVCQYNRTFHKGLGFLRTLKGVPQERWDSGIARAKPRPPIDPEAFAAFAGETKHLSIQQGTITWEKIVYYDARLAVLASDSAATPPPKSGDGRKPRRLTTRYKCVRDPSDIGFIYVHIPALNTSIKVFAHGEYRRYAKGLRLFQHRKAMEYYRKKTKRPFTNIRDYESALLEYSDEIKEAHAERQKQGTAAAVAAFYRSVARKVKRSELVDVKPDAEKSRAGLDYSKNSRPRAARNPAKADVPPARDEIPHAAAPGATHPRDEEGVLVLDMPEPKPKRGRKAASKPMPKTTGRVDRVEEPQEDLTYEEILARYSDEVRSVEK